MNKFSDRLKKSRTKKGLSQKALAEMLFVSQQTVAKWELDKSTPNPETISQLSDILNVSLDYLLGRIDSNVEFVRLQTQTVKIPVLGCIPAGVPIEAIEDILDYIEIPEEWLAGGKEFFGLKIKGDSMYPNYITGDVVIFEKANTCDNGAECAVMVNGDDATFKKVEIKPNGIMLKPLNPNYETLFFTNEEVENKPVRILGIAREIRRKL